MKHWGIEPHSARDLRQHEAIPSCDLRCELIVLAVAAAVFLGCIISPPSLMDDVDAVQAQIARNMLDSGDWVTARLDGIAYLEKSPLKYWMIAICFKIFGVHDWAARIAGRAVRRAAVLAGVPHRRVGVLACARACTRDWRWRLAIGLFLFTRIQIPDVTLTPTIALAMWAFLRALDAEKSIGRACGRGRWRRRSAPGCC